MTDYSRLPAHMRDAARHYVEFGYRPGSFLSAVLANNLVRAVGTADEINGEAIATWASWLYNEIPTEAWGSEASIDDWCKQGGRLGKLRKWQAIDEVALSHATSRYAELGLSEDDEAIIIYRRSIASRAAEIARLEAKQ